MIVVVAGRSAVSEPLERVIVCGVLNRLEKSIVSAWLSALAWPIARAVCR